MTYDEIQLPSQQYEWNLDFVERGAISDDGNFISQDKEGLISINVKDTHIANNTGEGNVKVVFPHSIDLEIEDVTGQMTTSKTLLVNDLQKSYQSQLNVTTFDNNWILVEGHIYLIKVFLFDKEKNQIQLTKNLVFKNSILKELVHFDIL